MNNYKLLNNIIGWAVFLIAAITYISTAEPTASFWDCGEYIATAYKLQVGHPPGAPTFQLFGRIFSMMAGGDVSKVAFMINTMSALCSAFTILFLFWSLTMLIKRLSLKDGNELDIAKTIAIFGSAVVGSLAYTFSDTFWFSAVEGEVYAMSSMFTAIVFWAILKWEQVAEQKDSLRWLLLIAFLVGLSIGVHLLNLLTVPAIVFVIYFKKFKTSRKGIFYASILSLLILIGILYGIIPGIVYLYGKIEIFFVNILRLPFNSGSIFFTLFIIAAIIWGLNYTKKKIKPILNATILSFAFLLIGYSTFLILIIRSNANPPIDENNPEDAVSLLSYLNRDQYGKTPLFYGQYYNAPAINFKDGTPYYSKDKKKGKYVVTDDRKKSVPVYDKRYTTVFPRMWSNQQSQHIANYKSYAGITNDPENKKIPTFGQNLKYMFSYQIGYMYFRYFMWNFVGRQNDIQGYGGLTNGNWLSGIEFLDEARIGPQDNIPETMKNKGRNRYYFIPLILGLLGLIFHFSKHKNDAVIVTLLFFMTGLAIAIYLNMQAYQPRERDYAFAASFYAFAIWLGIGVYAIFDKLKKFTNPKLVAVGTSAICLLLVPTIMAKENWDDHDRSNRYTVLAVATNYLNSCAPNAIIFTNGDNDTFPLWYAQEVEGVRTDIRICNLSLFNTDWYIDQMKRKAYNSEPVPMQMTQDQYRQGNRDYLFVYEKYNDYTNIKTVVNDFLDDSQKVPLSSGKSANIVTARKLFIPVDTLLVVQNGTVAPQDADKIVKRIEWEFSDNIVQKNMLGMMDILANFDWKRPIYFATTTGNDAYFGLEEYFQLEGLAYRLVPIKTPKNDNNAYFGRVRTDVLYDNLMNKFIWGNINDPKINLNEDNTRITTHFRNSFAKLATALIDEGKKDSALKVLNKINEIIPNKLIPYNYVSISQMIDYYRIDTPDAIKKGDEMFKDILNNNDIELVYFNRFRGEKKKSLEREISINISILYELTKIAKQFNRIELEKTANDIFNKHYSNKI